MARILDGGLALALAALAFVSACSPAANGDGQAGRAPVAGPSSRGEGEEPLPPIPAGAIEVGPDLYMVPLGKDADGCTMFRAFSQKLFVVQAIYYRDAQGRFVNAKNAAAC